MRLSAILYTFLWGLFCACSWTWCIGMYLPKILIDRWGWAGFIAFALPNVLGCAAMGFVVRTPQKSRSFVTRHAPWMRAFSIATIAYHAFFLSWFFSLPISSFQSAQSIGPNSLTSLILTAMPVLLAAAVCFAALRLIHFSDLRFLLAAGVTFGISIAVLFVVGMSGFDAIPWTGPQPSAHLALTIPTITFGFLLCPYLDATFHRAVQRSPSPHAFAIFGVTFLIMILLTCALWFNDPARIMRWLSLHVVAQSVFTIAVHARELVRGDILPLHRRPYLSCLLPIVAVVLWPVLTFIPAPPTGFDSWYLRYLGLYGLLFPAYVWLFTCLRTTPPSRNSLRHLCVIVLLSMPAYELGFLHRQPWWLLPPLAAFLFFKLIPARPPLPAAPR